MSRDQLRQSLRSGIRSVEMRDPRGMGELAQEVHAVGHLFIEQVEDQLIDLGECHADALSAIDKARRGW